MKKEVQELKSLHDYLSELSKEEFDELYQKVFENNKRKAHKDKVDNLYKYLVDHHLFLIFAKPDGTFSEVEDIIKGKHLKQVDQQFIDALFVIKTDDGYTTFEEVKSAIEKSKTKEFIKERKSVAFSFYVDINGVLEKNKLIELMAKTGFLLTEKEIKEYCKQNKYSIQGDLIYANSVAENLNIGNILLEIKQGRDYKVYGFEEIVALLLIETSNDVKDKVRKLLSKKINKEDIEEILYLVMTRVKAGDNYEDDIYELLTLKNINLGKLENEFYDLLEDYYNETPLWSLNGYTPREASGVTCEDDDSNVNDLEDDSKDELLTSYVYSYIIINGAIKLEDLFKLIKENYLESITKNELINFVKRESVLKIVNDFVVMENIPDGYLEIMSATKKINDFYLIDDFDDIQFEIDKSENKIVEILNKYGLSSQLKSDVVALANIGIFNEMMVKKYFAKNGVSLNEKIYSKLFSELRKCINNMRLWYLNGFKPNEISSVSSKEKVGRNDPCPCGSGKKYKKCCGK